MERDSHKEQLPLPSAEEAIVIRRILGQCLHGNTARSTVRRTRISTCEDCGEYQVLDGDAEVPVSPAEEARLWRASLPRPATHLVVAEQALALVGRSGWDIQIRQTGTAIVCKLSRGDRIVRSMPQDTRAAAIVDALAQMASEYRLVG
ncbi:hypothetical protein [Variovorax sp. UMC13]|uniref:hypothetical protein n=1 Tax=Variovorax sp. UMC13 TaxID=1862326 RepID=UPI00160326F7|nr:hypothetical protein [Variovorax sp. UMC13]MBB1599955.1 hypothetical protein [Variovorax sp. UMC13]